ncbi:sterol desaturase family protein [Acidovorax kalamii]|uniref:sterol desaturase family protein n=1 Tax=Acidovorax kalamii TaxID=2004485 RepID=UPI00209063AC|nr:sterol desaturase family protein [Acidovorax kalamii]MCO5357804.1 sterol desaturase family protein [Acidovorax kalamii]
MEHFDWGQYALFAVLLCVLVVVEHFWPRRKMSGGAWGRRRVNLLLYGVGGLLMWWVAEPVQTAAVRMGASLGWAGLAGAALPDILKIVIGVLLVDVIQYALHRASHAIPLLWRMHQVHHADAAFDVTTSVRHHPLEVMALAALTLMLCAALGLPLVSLLLYAVLQLVHTAFCHANVAIPLPWDRALRWVMVTPDMHRVHHSERMDEGNSNFGMIFPWWDRLLRTYCAQPALGHQDMHLGLANDSARPDGFWRAVCQPFGKLS